MEFTPSNIWIVQGVCECLRGLKAWFLVQPGVRAVIIDMTVYIVLTWRLLCCILFIFYFCLKHSSSLEVLQVKVAS